MNPQIAVAMSVLMQIGDTLLELELNRDTRKEQIAAVVRALRLVRDELTKGTLQ
jgi:hypothetical protein